MIIIGLAWEREASQHFIEILWIVDNEVIALRLAGEESVHSLWIEPLLAQGFAFHLIEARIEFGFELIPFLTVRIIRSPREAIKFVDVEVCQDDFKWHVLDNAHAEFGGRQVKRRGLDV